ncbi:MAG: hypothetical protein ACRCYR_08135 [Phycicoccus sp.]
MPGDLTGTLTARGPVDFRIPPNGPPPPETPQPPLDGPLYTFLDGPLEGTTVDLVGAGPDDVFGTTDDIRDSTVSAADGTYRFSGLGPGRYRISIEVLVGPVGVWYIADCTTFAETDWAANPSPPVGAAVTSGTTTVVDIAQAKAVATVCV